MCIRDSYNGEELHCTIGSTYTDLYKLRQSYLEALFLIANYDYLNVESSHALNIHDFIFEYAVSLIPRSYWNNRFQNLAQDLDVYKRQIMGTMFPTNMAKSCWNPSGNACANGGRPFNS